MNISPSKIAQLEVLLFQYGEPITIKKISKILGVKEVACQNLLNEYDVILKNGEDRGLALLRRGESFQLVTKPELEDITKKLVKNEFRQELTPATLEVLTIIAYLGPVARSDVDFIRGVNSSFSIRSLLMRGLIDRERKGNTYYYQVTFDFLKHMGLQKMEDLPEYEKYKNVLKEYEASA